MAIKQQKQKQNYTLLRLYLNGCKNSAMVVELLFFNNSGHFMERIHNVQRF